MLGSNTGQLLLAHWLSDALTIRLDLIHFKGFPQNGGWANFAENLFDEDFSNETTCIPIYLDG